MKKMVLSLMLLAFMAVPAMAQDAIDQMNAAEEGAVIVKDVVEKVPALKTGVAFSIVENNLNFMAVVPVHTFQKFTLNTGYAGAQPNTGHKAIVLVDYELYNPENFASGNSVLDMIVNAIDLRPGVWFGAGRIEKDEPESDWGVGLTLLQGRFW